ncbi:MAG: alanine dehydrogenase, partial [Rhodospirillaceae bacterium]|nr:alanine dehydrogenase [Rhodospirillaceae bacterium]
QFQSLITTLYSTAHSIEEAVVEADLVIGAVLVPGAAAPKLVTRDMVKGMKRGSVIVDVAIDQGGSTETSRPTRHSDPYYIEEGVVHYCVTNMPGAVARTSTFALNNATLPFIVTLADKGPKDALLSDAHLLNGLNVCHGKLTHPAVAEAQQAEHTDPMSALAA